MTDLDSVTEVDEQPDAWLALTGEQRRRCNEVRHEIFCVSGLENCTVTNPGDAHDEYDDLAAHIGVDYHGRTIGGLRLVMGGTPTEKLYPWIPGAPPLLPERHYSEPSRLGIIESFRGTSVGTLARLRLIGLAAETSMDLGFDEFVVIVLPDMFGAVSFFPLILSPPFIYPAELGGPAIEEPVWAGTLNLYEMALATKLYSESLLGDDRLYQVMFPERSRWKEPAAVHSPAQLRAIGRANKQSRRKTLADWKAGRLVLPRLAPPSLV